MTTAWFDRAVTAAAPAVRDAFVRQVDEQTQRALERVDWALESRAETPPAQRDERWHRTVDLILDRRLDLMTDLKRGFRVVDRRRRPT